MKPTKLDWQDYAEAMLGMDADEASEWAEWKIRQQEEESD